MKMARAAGAPAIWAAPKNRRYRWQGSTRRRSRKANVDHRCPKAHPTRVQITCRPPSRRRERRSRQSAARPATHLIDRRMQSKCWRSSFRRSRVQPTANGSLAPTPSGYTPDRERYLRSAAVVDDRSGRTRHFALEKTTAASAPRRYRTVRRRGGRKSLRRCEFSHQIGQNREDYPKRERVQQYRDVHKQKCGSLICAFIVSHGMGAVCRPLRLHARCDGSHARLNAARSLAGIINLE